MSTQDINGTYSHPHEDRYEVREGDVIFDRCRVVFCPFNGVDKIIKMIGAGIFVIVCFSNG